MDKKKKNRKRRKIEREENMRIADHSVTRAILERHGFTFKNPSVRIS